MIQIKYDVELMTSLLPADRVPVGNHFIAFKDENSNPALFSLSNNGTLNLIMEDEGEPTLYNFGESLGLEGTVLAFDVQQSLDLTLNIAVVVQGTDGKRSFHLVRRTPPGELLDGLSISTLTHGDGNAIPSTSRVFLSDFTRKVAGKEFPLVFLAFEREDRITKEEQLGLVDVTSVDGKPQLKLNTMWKLATNPEKILAVAFGTSPVGDGIFALYQTATGKKLQFRTFYGSDYTVEPTCPPGASCLASFLNPRTGYSVLLIGGDGVTAMGHKEFTRSRSPGTAVISPEQPLGLRGIHAAITNQNVTIWYTTATLSAHYYSADLDAMAAGRHVPLLKEGEGGRLSGILAARPATQPGASGDVTVNTIMSVSSAGELIVLQEASDTGMWKAQPFYVASETANAELDGYALRIQAVQDDPALLGKQPVNHCELRLISSDFMRVVVNGRVATLTREGGWYDCDAQGVLLVMIKSDDGACGVVQVDGYRPPNSSDDSGQGVTSQVMDPSTKVIKKLRGITSGSKLLQARTQTGEPLVKEGFLDAGDADTIAKHISDLCQKLEQRPPNMDDYGTHAGLKQGFLPDSLDDLVDTAWEFFQWAQSKAVEAWDWGVDTTKSIWTLSVKLAGGLYTFVLSTVEAIKKAIGWLLARAGIAVKKLIDYAGFIFNWSDILDTADSFHLVLQTGLRYGQKKLQTLNDNVQQWVNNLKQTVRDSRASGTEEILSKGSQLDNESQDEEQAKLRSGELFKYSVSLNWAGDQFSRVDPMSVGIAVDAPADSSSKLISDIWKTATDELGELLGLVNSIIDRFPQLFGSTADRTKAALSIANDVCDVALDSIENLAKIVFKAAALILKTVEEVGERPIDLPLFTALWHFIAGKDRPFTLLGCLSLLMAIPTTIVHKLLYGRAPPRLKGRVTVDVFAALFDEGPKHDDSAIAKDLRLFGGTARIGASCIALGFAVITLTRLQVSGLGTVGVRGLGGLRRKARARATMNSASTLLTGRGPRGPGGWTPRGWAILVEIGASVCRFAEVIGVGFALPGLEHTTSLILGWLVWSFLDLGWWLIACGIRIHQIWTTSKLPNNEHFMLETCVGAIDLGVSVFKFYINMVISNFEDFREGRTSNWRYLRVGLQYLDGGLDIASAGCYMAAASTGKSKKDASVIAAAAMVGLRVGQMGLKGYLKLVDGYIEDEDKERKKGG
ncbi:hypothetical protein B0T19DRAFT_404506 [Cercophora scortea]|uniref:Uncharacterized protein n=1 Tax=Cercophora scortea TaxID=314031 RepID=A0AAE0I7D8_9PEZI|nr:hypothetical protein B0T19DRAFT_404506 [Cercophora scortea]